VIDGAHPYVSREDTSRLPEPKMPRKRLIIGYNGTPQGEDALELGSVFAKALDAAVTVAVVVHYPRRHAEPGELEDAVAEYSEPLFAAARERLPDLDVRGQAIVGESPARGLYELAEEQGAVLTVLGSPRHGSPGRVILGSVGQPLLSGASSAIAVAPAGYSKREQRPPRIGVAVDGSAQSLRALQAAATLAGKMQPPLRVLTVAEPTHYWLEAALSPLSPEEYETEREGVAEGLLDEAMEQVPPSVSAEASLLHGRPADVLAEEAEGLDLLVLGSRGYGPVKGVLLGSVSAKLMGSAPCAVLVLPRGSGVDPLGA
jgi:nucleotide-binding universal stress UspA family protein